MKTGKTLQELAAELERQKETKRDFIAAAQTVKVMSNGHSEMDFGLAGKFPVNNTAHEHLASKLEIPKKYYDRMQAEAPALLDSNINHWLTAQGNDKLLLRTLDGNVRGVLSDKYRPLDNADLAEAILPTLISLDLVVMSCEVTERRMLIKAVDSRIAKDIPVGAKMGSGHTIFNTLSPGITISNSEIGFGSMSVLTSVFTKQCTNLATFSQRSVRKYHLGGKYEGSEAAYELMSDKTRQLSDAALWAQTQDVVKAAFDLARFDSLVEEIQSTVENKIEGDPVKAVEVTAKRFGLLEHEKTSVLKHLIQGADLSQYGLFNAITRTAEDLPDYDRATDFEKFGGSIIELPKSDWKTIATAA